MGVGNLMKNEHKYRIIVYEINTPNKAITEVITSKQNVKDITELIVFSLNKNNKNISDVVG